MGKKIGKKLSVNVVQVQSTNDASIVSKSSMARTYAELYKDEFVHHFVQKKTRRAPLIHKGYYIRAVIFSRIIAKYIKYMKECNISKFQIVSCGAGFDTTYWRLTEDGLLDKSVVFVEIDYPAVVKTKIDLISKSEKLKMYVKVPVMKGDEKVVRLSENYYILCADLCDLETVEKLLRDVQVDFSLPTIFLSECVITYMKLKDSNRLLSWSREKFVNSGFVVYEQIHPEDGFGEVMQRHFNSLQSNLHSLSSYPDCRSHRERYRSLGFDNSLVLSEWEFFRLLATSEELRKIHSFEIFDEFEEFHLKCSHYVVAVATNNFLVKWSDQLGEQCDFKDDSVQGLVTATERALLKDTEVKFELYGHASCQLRDNTILIFGGVGPNGRSDKVYSFRNGTFEEVVVSGQTGSGSLCFDPIHGSAVAFELNGRTYVGLYGGRNSPSRVWNDGDFTLMEYLGNELRLKCVVPSKGGPTRRYRSSVVSQVVGSEVSLWVYGGRAPLLEESPSDLWKLVIHEGENGTLSGEWSRQEENQETPPPRMSHGAALAPGSDAILVTCGFDTRKFTVLNDIWKWSLTSQSWQQIKPRNGELLPRYGHTSHIHRNVLYLVGGVNAMAGFQPGIALLDLETLHLRELSLEPFAMEPILLFNHTSAVLEDDRRGDRIFVFGGGGNCFSFGTYLNKTVKAVGLEELGRR